MISNNGKTKQNWVMLLWNCAVCGKKNLSFIKNQELHQTFPLIKLKMKKIIKKSLFNGDKFMPESHFKQPGFTYSACAAFTKHRERIKKFRETWNLKHLYTNENIMDIKEH